MLKGIHRWIKPYMLQNTGLCLKQGYIPRSVYEHLYFWDIL